MTTDLAETRNHLAVPLRPDSWAGAAARGLGARKEREAIVHQVLIKGVDTKPIPGCGDKPVLHDSGAQKILDALELWADYEVIKEVEDWANRFWFYRYRCTARQRGTNIAVSSGIGSCNSRESKYGYRWVPAHALPKGTDLSSLKTKGGRISEFDFAIQKGETTGKFGKPAEYWQQFRDAIASGEAKKISKPTKKGEMQAWEIDGTLYQVINEDVETQVNTIDKMAQKRAKVAACIALGFGEHLTQDIEENPEAFGGHSVPTYASDKGEKAEGEVDPVDPEFASADAQREAVAKKKPAPPPPEDAHAGITREQAAQIKVSKENWPLFSSYLGISKLSDIPASDLDFVMSILKDDEADWGDAKAPPRISLAKWSQIVEAARDLADPWRIVSSLAQINAPCDLPVSQWQAAMDLAKFCPPEFKKVKKEGA
jgi:hypothetical protein